MNIVQWHWKVFLNIEYWSYLDIPNLQNVELPNAFKSVLIPVVKSIPWIIDWILDVHKALAQFFPATTHSFEFIQSIDSSITSVIIPNWTCNDIDYTIFDFSRFTLVESIVIGNDCFGSVQTFKIDGLNRLKTIKIGNNSFTQHKDTLNQFDKSKSFHILNCESLGSIYIGPQSFSDFAGEFELKNLPQLQSIQIGAMGRYSNNFHENSFVIRGIDVILNIWMYRSSKSSNHYFRSSCIPIFHINSNRKYWMNLNEMIWIDLPSLQSIHMDELALEGRYQDDSCSLTMRSTNEMIWNDRM